MHRQCPSFRDAALPGIPLGSFHIRHDPRSFYLPRSNNVLETIRFLETRGSIHSHSRPFLSFPVVRNDFSRIFSKIRKRKREGKELDKSKEQDLTIQLEEGRKGIVRFRFSFLYSFDKRSSSIQPSSPMHDRVSRCTVCPRYLGDKC